MHIVLLNGPAGAGKNTLAIQIRTQLFSRINNEAGIRKLLKRPVSSIAIEEFKQPLINMLFAFAESLSVIELGTPITPSVYEDLKKTEMLGRLGREWQICWADAMRKLDPDVFVNGLHTKLKGINPDIAIVPDLGFGQEYTRTVDRFGSSNVTMFYLDGWRPESPIYKHYDVFKNDIRICLRDYASMVNPTASQAAAYIIGRMEENASQQSLAF